MTIWKPEFVKTVINPSVGKIDMYLMNDCQSGKSLVSVGVPHGDTETPDMIAKAVNAWIAMNATPMHGPRCPCTNCT